MRLSHENHPDVTRLSVPETRGEEMSRISVCPKCSIVFGCNILEDRKCATCKEYICPIRGKMVPHVEEDTEFCPDCREDEDA